MARRASSTLQRTAIAAVALAVGVPAVLAITLADDRKPMPTPMQVQVPAGTRPPVSQPVPPMTASTVTPVRPAAPVTSSVASVLRRPDRFDYGAWLWSGDAARSGPVLITVDLKAQLIRVWRGGHEIGVSTILYGAPDSPTPLGTFPITQKDADHVSNIYHSPMPYSLRLTNDGVMVHGSNVRAGWASNGCVGVPTPFAKQLFGLVKLGDKVVITDGKPLAKVGDPLPVV